MRKRPSFMLTFSEYVERGEWVTSAELARRIGKDGDVEASRDISRKLSNLERFGHLQRRRGVGGYEYSLPASCAGAALHAVWLQPTAAKLRSA